MGISGKLIKSAESVPSVKPSDTLSLALSKVFSSHEPVFVVNKGKLEGIITPSYCLFKKRFPLTTKAGHALIHPPKLHQDIDLGVFAKHMLSLDTYTLPITGEYGDIVGVVKAVDILKHLKDEAEILESVIADDVLTGSMHDKIRDVYSRLKKDKTSRIVIVDEKNRTIGIVTRRDIQEAFMATPIKGKSGRTKNNRTYLIEDKDLKKFDFTLGEFMKTRVNTALMTDHMSFILEKMISGKTNSVVLVDKNEKPKKIVSIKNFLDVLSKIKPVKKINFSLTDHHKVLLKEEKVKIHELTDLFSEKIGRSKPVRLLEGEVSAYFNKKGKVTGFEYHFHVYFMDGKRVSAKVEDKVLWNAVKKSMEKVQHQLKRVR